MLPRDPHTDPGRRAWIPCPHCHDNHNCTPCQQQQTCPTHWRYLLTHTGSLLHLQCPTCHHLWTHETHFHTTHTPTPHHP
ncbi:hypothetical protein [Streptomyces erythrochromogenes]|uniref:hypothetical protein n=1 Tax=Streptomyces erythrochromogenes TaxID=285574 RepID=UPI0036CA5EE4